MTRKPKGSHRAYKEWAPSVKLVLHMHKLVLHMHKSMAELQYLAFSCPFFWHISMRRFLQLGV